MAKPKSSNGANLGFEEKLWKSIFKHWFVDFEFPNEDGKPYRSSGGEMVDSERGAVPEGWDVGTLNKLIKITSGKLPNENQAKLILSLWFL